MCMRHGKFPLCSDEISGYNGLGGTRETARRSVSYSWEDRFLRKSAQFKNNEAICQGKEEKVIQVAACSLLRHCPFDRVIFYHLHFVEERIDFLYFKSGFYFAEFIDPNVESAEFFMYFRFFFRLFFRHGHGFSSVNEGIKNIKGTVHTGQRFLAAKHLHHFKNRRSLHGACQGDAQQGQHISGFEGVLLHEVFRCAF